jgi:hypothetical protein
MCMNEYFRSCDRIFCQKEEAKEKYTQVESGKVTHDFIFRARCMNEYVRSCDRIFSVRRRRQRQKYTQVES